MARRSLGGITREVLPAASGCPFWKVIRSIEPVQRISSVVDEPTEMPEPVVDLVGLMVSAACSAVVKTDRSGPQGLSWSLELVVSES